MPQTSFTTGPKYPTTTTTPNGSGSSGQWANPTNIFSDNGSNATSAFLGPPTDTDELAGAGFGMGIPPAAIIDGIKLEMEVPSNNRWDEAFSFLKLKKAGVMVGSNRAGQGSSSANIWSYGGATDLWGTTWTPAELNAANFGFGYFATYNTNPNDFAIAVDFVRITVFWHLSVDVAPADVPIRHLYKVFNDGRYLGNLPNVISEFGYAQDINSAGSSLTIECGVSADTSALLGNRLTTEAGDPITTEDGYYIYTDGPTDILGPGNSPDPLLIQNGNRIEVWQYDYYHPNGKRMFKGQMNRIEAGFGGGNTDKINIIALSNGTDLDNYIARGGPFTYTADVSQLIENTNIVLTQGSDGSWNRAGQTWRPGAGKLGSIKLLFRDNADVTVTVYDGFSGMALGSITKQVYTGGEAWIVEFAFASLITVVPGGEYFFTVSVAPGQSIRLYYSTANPYANGQMFSSTYGGGGGGSYTPITNGDLYFVASSGLPTTTATYTNKDPATEMFKPIIDDYRVRGGIMNYDSSSVDASGLVLTATFNTETILDAIKRCLSILPGGYYFYADLGTDTLYLKQTLSTPTHKLIKGRHLNKISLILSTENVKNDLLFSGAETDGTNLYTEYEDQESQSNYGRRLERKSDNRVSIQSTADALSSSFLTENKDEYYETTVTILYGTMDIKLFKPGQTVGLRGFGSFVDRLTLQIVRMEFKPEAVTLTIGNLPKRFSTEYEQLARGLVAQQTVANPAEPS